MGQPVFFSQVRHLSSIGTKLSSSPSKLLSNFNVSSSFKRSPFEEEFLSATILKTWDKSTIRKFLSLCPWIKERRAPACSVLCLKKPVSINFFSISAFWRYNSVYAISFSSGISIMPGKSVGVPLVGLAGAKAQTIKNAFSFLVLTCSN